MKEEDVFALSEISNNDNIYRYIPPFLYRKDEKFLLEAIRSLGGRDFVKKRFIIAGVYLQSNEVELVGLAEMFDYRKLKKQITVGYCLNEKYWHQQIATNILQLMKHYLTGEIGIKTLQAFVMPENIYSVKVLLHNGFVKGNNTCQEKNWGGRELAQVDVYIFTAGNKKK